MMPVVFPSPKQPDDDIDVYLKPQVDDLLLLWKEEGGSCVGCARRGTF
jgi:hypothetical protein